MLYCYLDTPCTILRIYCVNSVQIWSFFLVRIFLCSVRIQKNMDQKKLSIRTLFRQWSVKLNISFKCAKLSKKPWIVWKSSQRTWYYCQFWTWYYYCVKSVQIRSFFLVRIFPYLDWVRRDTPYISVFSPNEVKYGPEKTPYLDTFHVVEKPWLKQLLSLKNFFHSDMNNNSLVFNYSETLK